MPEASVGSVLRFMDATKSSLVFGSMDRVKTEELVDPFECVKQGGVVDQLLEGR